MKRILLILFVLSTLVSEAQFFKVRGLTLTATPVNDDAQTQVLVRNSTSGQVEYRSASTLLGSTDLSYTASTRLLVSSTGTDVTLPLFTSTDAGLVPLSGGGTSNFLRADGTWAIPLAGTDLSYTASTRIVASSTGADATLPLFTSTDPGLTPLSGGGTSNFLRADGTWTVPLAGTDLSYTASTRIVASSTGADATLPLFTSTDAGLVPLSGGGTDNFLRADGTWTTPTITLSAGTYTPTITAVSNVTSVTAYACQYMRVGNTVTVSGRADANTTVSTGTTSFRMSLPISSNFTSLDNNECAGTAHSVSSTVTTQILADTVNDEAFFKYTVSVVGLREFWFTFTYLVL